MAGDFNTHNTLQQINHYTPPQTHVAKWRKYNLQNIAMDKISKWLIMAIVIIIALALLFFAFNQFTNEIVDKTYQMRNKWQANVDRHFLPLGWHPIGLYDYFLFQTFGGLEKIA